MEVSKLTREQRIEAYTMRLDGVPGAEVARRFGVSREYIRKITQGCPSIHKMAPIEGCIYRTIATWMFENGLSYNKLAKEIGVSPQSVICALTGKHAPGKKLIDKILSYTGLTYEEAFRV